MCLILTCLLLAGCATTESSNKADIEKGPSVKLADGSTARYVITKGRSSDFTIHGYSASSSRAFEKKMTSMAVLEAKKRGFENLTLLSNKRKRGEKDQYVLIGNFRGFDAGSGIGKHQVLNVASFEARNQSKEQLSASKRKYRKGCLFYSCSAGGQLADAVMKDVATAIFYR